jgi:hypothetical protein
MIIMVNEEREAILRMVAAGKITVEQGSELLDALEPTTPAGPQRGRGLGDLLEEVLAVGLGRRSADAWSSHGPPRPPRPPRPPGPRRSARPEPRGAGPFSSGPNRPGLSFEDMVELKTQGVSKDYIEEMRDILPDLGLGELLECRDAGVQPDYARGMMDAFSDIDTSQLVELREAGVTVDFASALHDEFPDIDPSAVIEAAEEGVGVEDLDFFLSRGGRRTDDSEVDRPENDAGDWTGRQPE